MNYGEKGYVVISDIGWYARKILEKYPNYRGIDRYPWPISAEDLKGIQGLSESEQSRLIFSWQQIDKLLDTEIFCADFNLVRDYVKLCNILHIDVQVLVCKICADKPVEHEKLCTDGKEYEWIGYDYGMKGTFYSCIIQEKELMDTIEKIELNENGLLRDFEDAKRFGVLREQVKAKFNGNGFEYGSAGVDFYAIALFRCMGV